MTNKLKYVKIEVHKNLTLKSQLPEIKKFCCNVAGLNSKAEMLSSGGAVTSKSLPTTGEVWFALNEEFCPSCKPPPNILTQE